MTRKTIARAVKKCSAFQAATRPFPASSKTASTKAQAGAIRRVVERSTTDDRESQTTINLILFISGENSPRSKLTITDQNYGTNTQRRDCTNFSSSNNDFSA